MLKDIVSTGYKKIVRTIRRDKMLIDGKETARIIRESIKRDIDSIRNEFGKVPSLAIISVGNDKSSLSYIRGKMKAAKEVGIEVYHYNLTEETNNEESLINIIKELVDKNLYDGMMIQSPLPKGYDERKIFDLVPEHMDVDGLSSKSVARTYRGNNIFTPCTPAGIMTLLDTKEVDIEGKIAVVVGRSDIVGKPMAHLLLQKNATVIMSHSKTKDLGWVTKMADILIVAAGSPNLIKKDMVKEGAVIIDAGINVIDGNIVGDVDFEDVKDTASYITPVPGGVGPMTVAMLQLNTVKAFKIKHKKEKKHGY